MNNYRLIGQIGLGLIPLSAIIANIYVAYCLYREEKKFEWLQIYAPPLVVLFSVLMILSASTGFGSKDILKDLKALSKIDKVVFSILALCFIVGLCMFSYGVKHLGLL